ncbi:histidine kinase, partial [Kitasatospora sp. NPDC058190]
MSKAQDGPEEHRSARDRLRSRLRVRSVAGQVFLWLLVVVVLLVGAALTTLILQAHNYAISDAGHSTRAGAVTLARYPGLAAALDSADPTAVLQPLALDVQKSGGFDYIVIFGTDGTRYAQTAHPELIGQHVYGDYQDSLKGPYTTTEDIPLGPDVDTTVAVTRPDGSVAGFLSVGYYVKNTTAAVSRQLPVLLGGAAAAHAVGTGGAVRVRR